MRSLLVPFYTVYCAACDRALATGRSKRSLAGAYAMERGWTRSPAHGWRCPGCSHDRAVRVREPAAVYAP